ncbi:hypothetical protein OOK58_42235 [Streptomyces sp. NBC_01728]|uniref:hypothetical protein n=1 Tax=unclassified Streptomyces TaxID=2593676 RepID=UPI0022588201|nr:MULTISPECIES: hypothetical protein [unclassified Streptomyces]MCX4458535.1 hypothetical protein [Streptomyces sp. NBC_01719]MCX4497892.1 hypothetical protein [Streptomyces sp. NBC_01728]
MDATPEQEIRCLKCRRRLRKPSPDGLGPKCRAKIRRKARNEGEHPLWQVNKAIELLELGAVIPLRQNRVFLVVADDGNGTYLTAATGQCNCPAGLRSIRCYHAVAAHLVAAA